MLLIGTIGLQAYTKITGVDISSVTAKVVSVSSTTATELISDTEIYVTTTTTGISDTSYILDHFRMKNVDASNNVHVSIDSTSSVASWYPIYKAGDEYIKTGLHVPIYGKLQSGVSATNIYIELNYR